MPSLNYSDYLALAKVVGARTDELKVFIETGTFMGDTIDNLSPFFDEIHSIELSPDLHQRASLRFLHDRHIKLHFGDSSSVLRILIPKIDKPAVFWLDGHWSGGITARGEQDCPLLTELQLIMDQFPHKALILIDDYRLFGTNLSEDWSDVTHEKVTKIVLPRIVDQTLVGDRLVLNINEQRFF
jgi:hypothetical protein